MARLTSLPARVVALPNRIGALDSSRQAIDRYRDATQPLRALYKTKRWEETRQRIFVRDLFTCQWCGKLITDPSQRVCDHVVPHRGDVALFWPEANLQTLCKPCHDSPKAAAEARAERGR